MENHLTKNEIRYKSKTNSALQFEQTNNRYCTNNKNKIENEKKTAPNNFFFNRQSSQTKNEINRQMKNSMKTIRLENSEAWRICARPTLAGKK